LLGANTSTEAFSDARGAAKRGDGFDVSILLSRSTRERLPGDGLSHGGKILVVLTVQENALASGLDR
jgi:hypothetical protein